MIVWIHREAFFEHAWNQPTLDMFLNRVCIVPHQTALFVVIFRVGNHDSDITDEGERAGVITRMYLGRDFFQRDRGRDDLVVVGIVSTTWQFLKELRC